MVLSRDAILAVADVQTETVAVPEWGGEVIVRGLDGAGRDSLEAYMTANKGQYDNFSARLVSLCLVDDRGERVFSDADIVKLGRKSAAALRRIVEAAQKLSGVSEGDVEELTKN